MPNEPLVRLTGFLSTFILLALWEVLAPCRPLTTSKTQRWFSNLSIVFLNTLVVRLLFSTQAVGWAVIADQKGWGVLHLLGWSGGMAGTTAVVILDLALYLQHVMFHAVPLLWRFHMMHHADLDVDVTTGARFHPVDKGS
ncbi:MAG: sterol desaturase family protein [Nitrospirae bacterium]|nr:sterol desaturase family protein [Nitrospirota bacterium]